jgi:choloylglycine hydrolase
MCTSLILMSQEGPVFARAMQWHLPNMNWKLVLTPKGTISPLYEEEGKKVKFPSRYAALTIQTPLAENVAIDGQNEAGLSVSAHYLPYFTKYPTNTSATHKSISVTDFANAILAHHASVTEVAHYLQSCMLRGPDQEYILPLDLHFLISDQTGENIVVESIQGKTVIHHNALGVLTNAPNYAWHLVHLHDYLLLTPEFESVQHQRTALQLEAFSQGSGTMGMPGGLTSADRFVRAVFFKNTFPALETLDEVMPYIAQTIETFNFPLGSVVTSFQERVLFETTQFTLLKDLVRGAWYIRSAHHLNYHHLNVVSFFLENRAFSIDLDTYPSIAAPCE